MAVHVSTRMVQAFMGQSPSGRWSRRELEDFLGGEIRITRMTCKHSKQRVQEFMIFTENYLGRPLNEIASAMLGSDIYGDVVLAQPWEIESMNSKTITVKGNQ